MMLNKSDKLIRKLINALALTLVVNLFFYNNAFALSVDITTMITNLTNDLPNLMRLVTAMAYVLGMYFIIKGVIGLKNFGDSRSSHDPTGGLKGPLALIFVGAALLYLPTSVQTGISTFWQNTSPLAYIPQTGDSWGQLIGNLFIIIQLIGTIAFIRGLVILSHLGERHGQGGGFGKAMAHIIGGILCINMYQFIQAVSATLGVSV